MNLNSIPDAFQSSIRVAIISCLLTGEKTFREIKDITNATDGNLSSHLSKLEQMEYINVSKQFLGKKPITNYSLTDEGRVEFINYVELLQKILESSNQ